MADDKIEVTFGARIDELVSGMQDMSSAVQDQLGKINDSMKEMSEQAQKAAEAIKVADDSIKASNEAVVASFKSFQEQATNAFNSLQAGISKVMGVFGGLTAILGGGALFKGVIDSATRWTTEVDKLSRSLGINMRAASDLNVALRLVGSDADTYAAALNKLERQLRTNEETLKSWGMVTRDSNNELVNGQQAMQNAVAMILEYKQGLDQGFASQVAFGRGNEQIAPLLRLNDEIMAHAIQTAKLFGLEVGTENVAAMRNYQREVNESKLVLEKLEEMIGNEVMKAMKELASFMNDQGVSAIGAFEGALKGLEEFLDGVRIQAISVRMALQGLAALPGAILAGEAGGAAFAELLRKNEEEWAQIKTAHDNKYHTPDMIGPPAPEGANAENKGLDQVGGTTTKGKSAPGTGANTGLDLAAAQEELTQLKNSYQNWYTWSEAREGDFWAQKLKQTQAGSAEAVAVYDKMMAAYKQSAADSKKTDTAQDLVTQYAEELEKVKNSQENLYTWSTQKEYDFWAAKLTAMRQGSAEAQEVWNKMGDLLRSMAAQQQQVADKAAKDQIATNKLVADMEKSDAETHIKVQQGKINSMVALDQMSAKKRLTAETALYEQEYTAALTAQYKELADIQAHGNATIAEQAKVYLQIEKLQNEHVVKMQQTQDQYLAAEKKQWDGYADQVGNAMTSMLFHHQTMLQTMQSLTQKAIGYIIDSRLHKLVNAWIQSEGEKTAATQGGAAARSATENAGYFSQILTKITSSLASWLGLETGKTAATTTGASTREAAETAATAAGHAAQIASNVGSVMADAAVAYAGAFAATAMIPYVGPMIAPAVASASMAEVLAMLPMASMDVGAWEVPRDMVAQIHQGEMVVPRNFAEGMRSGQGDGNAEPGGGGDHFHVHIPVSSPSVKDFSRQLKDANSPLMKQIKTSFRDFHLRIR